MRQKGWNDFKDANPPYFVELD